MTNSQHSNTEKRRQIGIFGGSFNPPHVGHTLATLWALQTHAIDQVWWVPTCQHAFSKHLAPFEHRLDMCKIAVENINNVEVSTIEQQIGGESRTIDTIKALRELHPDTDFWLIVGGDILNETDKWKNWDELITLVRLLVVGREGFKLDKPDPGEPFRLPDVSSTSIRDALARFDYKALGPWLPRKVIDYIILNELYGSLRP